MFSERSWYISFRGTWRHIPESCNLNWIYQCGSTGCKDAHCQFVCSVSSVSHETQVMYALKVELGVSRPVTLRSGWDGHQPVTAYRIWVVMGPWHSSRARLPAYHRGAAARIPGKPACELWWQSGTGICFYISNSVSPCRSTVGLVVLMVMVFIKYFYHQKLWASIVPQRALLLLGKNISETGCATRSFAALDSFFFLHAPSKKVVDVHVGRHTKGTVNALHKEHWNTNTALPEYKSVKATMYHKQMLWQTA